MRGRLPAVIALVLTLATTVDLRVAQASTNRIIGLEGNVRLKRQGRSQYRPIGVGTALHPGDLLWPEPEARVTVRCANNTTQFVSSGVPSGLGAICPEIQFSTGARGEDNFLQLLTSRFVYQTQVLEDTPLLRWPLVPEASSYRLRVSAGDELVWEQVTAKTQTPYTGPALQPGVAYELVVEAIAANRAKPCLTLRLTRLDAHQVEEVQRAVAQIQAQTLGKEAQALALADFYSGFGALEQPGSDPPGLMLQAIAVLEPLVAQGSETAVIHRLLGDYHLQVGLPGLAAARYRQALRLADREAAAEEQAAAQMGLANVSVAVGQLAAAERWLNQARESYLALEAGERASNLAELLRKLSLYRDAAAR